MPNLSCLFQKAMQTTEFYDELKDILDNEPLPLGRAGADKVLLRALGNVEIALKYWNNCAGTKDLPLSVGAALQNCATLLLTLAPSTLARQLETQSLLAMDEMEEAVRTYINDILVASTSPQ